MELGIREGWDDGCCCTGVLVRADPEAAARALGSEAVALVEAGAVVSAPPERPRAFALASPGPSRWTVVEWDRSRGDLRDDYLLPMFEEVEQALRGTPPDGEGPLAYERPIAVAARLARRTGAPAIALWGSDEWPGLGGAALFAADGSLEQVTSVADLATVERAHQQRRDDVYDNDDDDDDDDDASWVYRPGQAPERVEVFIESALDALLREREAGFDNSDLLSTLAEGLGASGSACPHATSFWVAL